MPPIERIRAIVALAIVLACSLSLRLPALDAVALNPDESQYEAVAAHVVRYGVSEFDRPETIGGGFSLYRIASELFGPYPTRAIRVLVLGIDVGCAALLFVIVRRVGGEAAGLVAALAFQHWAIGFEGQSANREWFALLPLLLAVALALRRLDQPDDSWRARAVWVASGVLAGAALWFKVQALGLLVAVPAAIVWDGRRPDRSRVAIARLAYHLGGGLVAGAIYLAPIAVHGALGAYVEMISSGWAAYVRADGAGAAADPGGGVGDALASLVGGLPSRGFVVLAVGTVVAWLVVRRPRADAATAVSFVALALGAAWSISLGGRFFAHYFLLLVPAVAALFGLALGLALRAGRSASVAVPAVAIGVYALERTWSLFGGGGLELLRRPSSAPLYVLGLVVLVAVGGWVALDARRRAWSGLAGLIVLELVLLVVPVQLGPRPRSVPHLAGGLAEAARVTRAAAGGDGELFVWGWLPELYTLTRLAPASHHVTCQYLVGDFAPAGGATLATAEAVELVATLESRRPAVIVDASARSWTMAADRRPTRYALDALPQFGLKELLSRGYRPVARADDCVIYRRVDGGELR